MKGDIDYINKSKFVRILFGGTAAFVALLITQVLSGKAGHYIADLVPYDKIDPYDIFAGISIHHVVQMFIALLIIAALGKWLKLDFCFKIGDAKKGIRYLAVFTAVFAVLAVAINFFQPSVYDFPLNSGNILGTLGFQLFLSGPSEEIVFRALPVTMLIFAFGKSISLKGSITLEVILASILFSFAHTEWSLIPFSFKAEIFTLIYAFVLGTIQGIVYQKTRSILYPMLMHSVSNFLMVGVGYLFAVL
jgi:membrane protease YdiL (CAAX protease family)